MKRKTLVLGDYQVNCYLVSDEAGRAVIIDPGYEAEKILRVVKEDSLEILAGRVRARKEVQL